MAVSTVLGQRADVEANRITGPCFETPRKIVPPITP
jgi:hypothetical protein